MDRSFAIVVAMGFLSSVLTAGLFQTATAVLRRPVSEKPTRR